MIRLIFLLFLCLPVFGDVYIKNDALIEPMGKVVNSGGVTVLTKDSDHHIQFVGTLGQTVRLPDAMSVPIGRAFFLGNRSTNEVTVNFNDDSLAVAIPANSQAEIRNVDNTTSNGEWDVAKMVDGVAVELDPESLHLDGSKVMTGDINVGNQDIVNAASLELDDASNPTYTISTDTAGAGGTGALVLQRTAAGIPDFVLKSSLSDGSEAMRALVLSEGATVGDTNSSHYTYGGYIGGFGYFHQSIAFGTGTLQPIKFLMGAGTVPLTIDTNTTDPTIIIGNKQSLREDSNDGLELRNNTAGNQTLFTMSTTDQDNTDPLNFIMYGLGNIASANVEGLRFSFDSGSNEYEIYTESAGTGVARDLWLGVGSSEYLRFDVGSGDIVTSQNINLNGNVDIQGSGTNQMTVNPGGGGIVIDAGGGEVIRPEDQGVAGAAAPLTIRAADQVTVSVSDPGGDLTLRAGNASGATSTGDGGDLILRGGGSTGGNPGSIIAEFGELDVRNRLNNTTGTLDLHTDVRITDEALGGSKLTFSDTEGDGQTFGGTTQYWANYGMNVVAVTPGESLFEFRYTADGDGTDTVYTSWYGKIGGTNELLNVGYEPLANRQTSASALGYPAVEAEYGIGLDDFGAEAIGPMYLEWHRAAENILLEDATSVTLKAGLLKGGDKTAASTAGQSITLRGGNATGTGAASVGGDLDLGGGSSTNSTDGVVNLVTDTSLASGKKITLLGSTNVTLSENPADDGLLLQNSADAYHVFESATDGSQDNAMFITAEKTPFQQLGWGYNAYSSPQSFFVSTQAAGGGTLLPLLFQVREPGDPYPGITVMTMEDNSSVELTSGLLRGNDLTGTNNGQDIEIRAGNGGSGIGTQRGGHLTLGATSAEEDPGEIRIDDNPTGLVWLDDAGAEEFYIFNNAGDPRWMNTSDQGMYLVLENLSNNGSQDSQLQINAQELPGDNEFAIFGYDVFGTSGKRYVIYSGAGGVGTQYPIVFEHSYDGEDIRLDSTGITLNQDTALANANTLTFKDTGNGSVRISNDTQGNTTGLFYDLAIEGVESGRATFMSLSPKDRDGTDSVFFDIYAEEQGGYTTIRGLTLGYDSADPNYMTVNYFREGANQQFGLKIEGDNASVGKIHFTPAGAGSPNYDGGNIDLTAGAAGGTGANGRIRLLSEISNSSGAIQFFPTTGIEINAPDSDETVLTLLAQSDGDVVRGRWKNADQSTQYSFDAFFSPGAEAFRLNRSLDAAGFTIFEFAEATDEFSFQAGVVEVNIVNTLDVGGAIQVDDVQVVSNRATGWGTATGTATRTTFDTTTVTTQQLAERVKALIDDMHSTAGHGLIGN